MSEISRINQIKRRSQARPHRRDWSPNTVVPNVPQVNTLYGSEILGSIKEGATRAMSGVMDYTGGEGLVGTVAGGIEDVSRVALPMALRGGGAVAGGLVTGPGAAVGAPIGAALGDVIAQGVEGFYGDRDRYSPMQTGVEGFLGFIPGSQASSVPTRIGVNALSGAGQALAANTVQSIEEQGRLPTKEEALWSSAIGGGAGGGLTALVAAAPHIPPMMRRFVGEDIGSVPMGTDQQLLNAAASKLRVNPRNPDDLVNVASFLKDNDITKIGQLYDDTLQRRFTNWKHSQETKAAPPEDAYDPVVSRSEAKSREAADLNQGDLENYLSGGYEGQHKGYDYIKELQDAYGGDPGEMLAQWKKLGHKGGLKGTPDEFSVSSKGLSDAQLEKLGITREQANLSAADRYRLLQEGVIPRDAEAAPKAKPFANREMETSYQEFASNRPTVDQIEEIGKSLGPDDARVFERFVARYAAENPDVGEAIKDIAGKKGGVRGVAREEAYQEFKKAFERGDLDLESLMGKAEPEEFIMIKDFVARMESEGSIKEQVEMDPELKAELQDLWPPVKEFVTPKIYKDSGTKFPFYARDKNFIRTGLHGEDVSTLENLDLGAYNKAATEAEAKLDEYLDAVEGGYQGEFDQWVAEDSGYPRVKTDIGYLEAAPMPTGSKGDFQSIEAAPMPTRTRVFDPSIRGIEATSRAQASEDFAPRGRMGMDPVYQEWSPKVEDTLPVGAPGRIPDNPKLRDDVDIGEWSPTGPGPTKYRGAVPPQIANAMRVMEEGKARRTKASQDATERLRMAQEEARIIKETEDRYRDIAASESRQRAQEGRQARLEKRVEGYKEGERRRYQGEIDEMNRERGYDPEAWMAQGDELLTVRPRGGETYGDGISEPPEMSFEYREAGLPPKPDDNISTHTGLPTNKKLFQGPVAPGEAKVNYSDTEASDMARHILYKGKGTPAQMSSPEFQKLKKDLMGGEVPPDKTPNGYGLPPEEIPEGAWEEAKRAVSHLAVPLNREIMRSYGSIGEEAYGRLMRRNLEYQSTLGRSYAELKAATKGMTDEDAISVFHAAQGQGEATPGGQRALAWWKSFRQYPVERARKAGIEAGQLENYFPHVIKEDVGRRVSTDKDFAREVQKELRALNPGITDEQLQALINKKFIRKASIEKSSYLEQSRRWAIPEKYLEKDLRKALPDYLDDTFSRITIAEEFGANDERLLELLGKFPKDTDPNTVGHFNQMVERALGRKRDQEGWGGNLAAFDGSYNAFTKLSLGGITNIGDLTKAYTRFGAKNTLLGIKDALTESGRDFGTRAGNITPILKHMTREMGESEGWLKSVLNIPIAPLKFTEGMIRDITANAAKRQVQSWVSRLAKNKGDKFARRMLMKLGSYDLDPDAFVQRMASRGHATEEELSKLATRAIMDSQPTNAGDMPFYAHTSIAKLPYRFKSFVFKQGEFMWDHVAKEAAQGNALPLLRFIVAGAVLGEGVLDLKDFIQGKEQRENPLSLVASGDARKIINRLMENLLAVGGIGLATEVLEGIRYGGFRGMARMLMGPLLSDIGELVEGFAGGAEKLGEAVDKKFRRSIPFVGPALKNAKYPVERRDETPYADWLFGKEKEEKSKPYRSAYLEYLERRRRREDRERQRRVNEPMPTFHRISRRSYR